MLVERVFVCMFSVYSLVVAVIITLLLARFFVVIANGVGELLWLFVIDWVRLVKAKGRPSQTMRSSVCGENKRGSNKAKYKQQQQPQHQ